MRALFSAVGSRFVAKGATALACVLLLSTSVWAQQASGITGTVKDAAGKPVAAVKVEIASPVLIEKVRTVTTDSQGVYKVTDLPVGVYDVTFGAAGFSTVKTVGVDLPVNFTATVNGALKAGSPAETITVTATTSTIDTRSTSSTKTLSAEALAASGQKGDVSGAVATTAGLTTNSSSTGSSTGGAEAAAAQRTSTVSFHGRTNLRAQFDGLRTGNFEGAGTFPAYFVNTSMIAATTVQGGGGSVEYAAPGAAISMVPKSGGNTWAFTLAGSGMTDKLSTDNLTDELKAKGILTSSKALNKYDIGWTSGGPISKNKIFLFQSNRYFGSKTQFSNIYYNATQGKVVSPIYTPDLTRPGYRKEWTISPAATRITWQVTPRNRLNLYADLQKNCTCMANTTGGIAPEAIIGFAFYPMGGFIGSWTAPVTSKLLLEGAAGMMLSHLPRWVPPEDHVGDVSILESTTNIRYNASAPTSNRSIWYSDRWNQRFSASYTTGKHAFKFGFQDEQARSWNKAELTGPGAGVDANGLTYVYKAGKPSAVIEYALPYYLKNNGKAEYGLFAQDTWNLKRLTLSYGVRYDNFIGGVPAQHADYGGFAYSLPARDYAAVPNVVNNKDVTPRMGASYDVFGNGRTALRATVGKYLDISGNTQIGAMNPITRSVLSVNRTWTDNGDFKPQCNFADPTPNGECAQISNSSFGLFNPNSDKLADDVLKGFGNRIGFWDFGAEVTHQIRAGLTVNAGYYHNYPNKFLVTDNTRVGPSNYDAYCFTAPTDARLGANSGKQICGLYDIQPAFRNSVANIVSQATNVLPDAASGYKVVLPSAANCGYQDPGNPNGAVGVRTAVLAYDSCGKNTFVNFGITASRLPRGITAGFSVDSGTTDKNSCFVVDSPQQLLDCHQVIPWKGQTSIRANATVPLPYTFMLSVNYQDDSGAPIFADYGVLSKDTNLPRALAACGSTSKATCTAVANVPLIDPYTQFLQRKRQLDLRFAKTIRFTPTRRLNVGIALGNVLNASDTTQLTTAFGDKWLNPITMTAQRQINLSGTLSF